MSDPIAQLQADVFAKLGAEAFFAPFPMLLETNGLTQSEYEKSTQIVKVKSGKMGAALVVMLPEAKNDTFGSAVIEDRASVIVRVLEMPKINRGAQGIGVAWSEISREVKITLNTFILGGTMLSYKGTTPYNDGDGTIGENVVFEIVLPLPRPVKCAQPRISGTLSAVSITTSTPGATIRVTIDGSFPSQGNTAAFDYTAPFTAIADMAVRAAAWKSDRQGSDVAEQTF